MPAQLLALTGGDPILLDRPIMLFGRHPECDVQLNSRKISRRHCCVAQTGDSLIVRDLGSTNGVRINNERVIEGKLKDGDELTIGNFRYQVCCAAGMEQSRRSPPPPQGATLSDDGVDRLLESSDEPVALPDDHRPTKAARPAPPSRTPPPSVQRPPGVDIPDNLTLAPQSDPPQRNGRYGE